jgi:hypothetical protein
MALSPALLIAIAALVAHTPAAGSELLGATGLRARHAAASPQLAGNAFGGPLLLESAEKERQLQGDVYAVLPHPFAAVSAALAQPSQWCEILILHLNTKHCRRTGEGGATRIEMRVGRKHDQPVDKATPLSFQWEAPYADAGYVAVRMVAPEGPFDTRAYRLMVEAIPVEGGRTFLHMGYAFSFGASSRLAMQLYLATLGRDKVGFTVTRAGPEPDHVGGIRGVVERNTMRYYLAIDAYLASLAAPGPERIDRRFAAWFDATERYPRQLHEIDREEYLRMKRGEYQRQNAAR